MLVLRASGSDGCNDYMFNDLGVNIHRVTTVVYQAPSSAYNDEVLALVEGAGDLVCWRRSSCLPQLVARPPLNDAINDALTQRDVVVGGTSAGMAILGRMRFTAQNGAVYTEEALASTTPT